MGSTLELRQLLKVSMICFKTFGSTADQAVFVILFIDTNKALIK